jgi:hypothetical protein
MKKLLVFLLVLGLASPAMAADWNFYGSARTHLGYYHVSNDFVGGPAMDDTIRSHGVDSDSGTLLNLEGQSRFGAMVAASDNLAGRLEFGFHFDGSPYLRLLYGTWNFGPGQLIAGQDYTPATFLGYSGMDADIGDQGGANMLVSGLAYIGRQPQLKLKFGTFELAFIKHNTAAVAGYTDQNSYLPRVEAAYVFRTPIIAIRPILGFQTYTVDGSPAASKAVNSYVAGLGVSLTLGPAYVKATGSWEQNATNYGQTNLLVSPAQGAGATSANLTAGGDISNSTLWQGTAVVGMKINPMFGVEAGAGYGRAHGTVASVDVKEHGWIYYVQAPVTLAKGFTVIPEIGYLNRGDLHRGTATTPEGDMKYIDVNFRIDF